MPVKKTSTPKSQSSAKKAVEEARYRNWLKEMDRKAKHLPKAEDNYDYWLFWLVRYPWLRAHYLLGTVEDRISEYESYIVNDEKTRRVAEGLNKRLRRQLAALVIDTCSDLDDFVGKKKLKKVGKEAPSRISNLRKKVRKAQKELEALHAYASGIHRFIGEDTKKKVKRCMDIIMECKIPSNDIVEILPKYFENRSLKSRTGLNMVKLYWFFRYGCELSGDEAEVRVAIIRKHFWDLWVDPVPYLPEYDGIENKGCPAVHSAVKNFR